jgi:hypothetical protein
MHNGRTSQKRAQDVKMLKESGVHKLVIADHKGNCLAYLLAWDSFGYDAETDTYVCFAQRDGRELMSLFTEGDVKPEPGTNRYVVTAPVGNVKPGLHYVAADLAI